MNPHPTRSTRVADLRVNPIWPMAALAAALLGGIGTDAAIARAADSAQKSAVIALDAQASRKALDRGTQTVYTISLRNRGQADAAGARLVAALPVGIDAATWTCAGAAGARCPRATGSGAIDATITDMPAGGILLYTVDARVAAAPPPLVRNTIRVELPKGASCADRQASPCTAHLDLPTGPRVDVQLTSNVVKPTASQALVYTLTVRNPGSVDAAGTVVRDPVPFGLTQFDWTCTGSAPCPRSSGKGSLHEVLAQFPPDSSLIYTITARSGAQPPSRIIHTATANPPYAGSCGEGSAIHAPPCVASAVNLMAASCGTSGHAACPATSTKSLTAGEAILSISQSTLGYGVSSPGFSYVVDVVNAASSPIGADGSVIDIQVPNGISSFDAWFCTKNGQPCSIANGTGAVNQTLDVLQPGDDYTFTINVTKNPSPPSPITNTVTVTPPGTVPTLCAPGNTAPPCVSQFSLDPYAVATLTLLNSNNVGSASPGAPVQYTVSLNNQSGGASADGTLLSDPLPSGIASWSWTCVANGAECPALSGTGPLNETLAVFPAGTGVTYTIDAIVAQGAPVYIENIATATAAPGVTAVCSTGASAPCGVIDVLTTVPVIVVGNNATTPQATAGGTVSFMLDVANFGAPIGGVLHISDPVPAGVGNVTWTCSTNQGQGQCEGGNSGTGAISQDITLLAPLQTVSYVIDGVVDTPAPNAIANVATVTPPPSSVCGDASFQGPGPPPTSAPPCVAEASVYSTAVLDVTKTANTTQLVPGGVATYTVTLSDAGLGISGARLFDPVPPGIDHVDWVCTSYSPDIMCPVASGTGDLDQTFGNLFNGASLVYTLTALVSQTALGSVTNTATVTAPAGSICNGSCAAVSTLPVAPVPTADLKITKTADVTVAAPGASIVYTVTVLNDGAAPAMSTLLSDPMPSGITAFSWTCASAAQECPNASGSGSIAETIPTLTGQVQYTVTATVSPAVAQAITNTATVTPMSGVTCNQSLCSATATVPIQGPNVVVTNSSSVADGTPVLAGQPIRWTLSVSNDGTPTAGTLTLTDTLPTGIEAIHVTADPGALCTPTQPAPGQTLVCTIAAGFTGTLRVVINAVVSVDSTGTLRNNVTASGSDQPACNTCSISNPITVATGVALGNPRPFSAAGINGYLFDLVNLRGAVAVTLTASPASAVQLFGSYAIGCTTRSDGDEVVVACPPSSPTQQLNCSGAKCSIDTLAAGETITVFVAANGSATLTIQANASGDVVPENNSLQIPPPSGAP